MLAQDRGRTFPRKHTIPWTDQGLPYSSAEGSLPFCNSLFPSSFPGRSMSAAQLCDLLQDPLSFSIAWTLTPNKTLPYLIPNSFLFCAFQKPAPKHSWIYLFSQSLLSWTSLFLLRENSRSLHRPPWPMLPFQPQLLPVCPGPLFLLLSPEPLMLLLP